MKQVVQQKQWAGILELTIKQKRKGREVLLNDIEAFGMKFSRLISSLDETALDVSCKNLMYG